MIEIIMTIVGLGYGCYMLARAFGIVPGRFRGELTPQQLKQQKMFCLIVGVIFNSMGLIYAFALYQKL